MVVVVMGGEGDGDARNTELVFEGREGCQPRPAGRTVGSVRQAGGHVVAVIDDQRLSVVVGQQQVTAGETRPVEQQVVGDRDERIPKAVGEVPRMPSTGVHVILHPCCEQVECVVRGIHGIAV
jgi:hypothetical protein